MPGADVSWLAAVQAEQVTSVTIGLPVSDLAQASAGYQLVFALGDPDLTPAHGVLEFQVGPVWLQLTEGPTDPGPITRFGVADAAAEHHGLAPLGIFVGSLEHVEDAVTYFDFPDPYGNRFSLYSMADH